MANEEQLTILKQGVDAWNKWRKNNPATILDLSEANLSGFDLRKVNFEEVDLFRTILTKANLANARLFKAALSGANLVEADLTGANLVDANLTVAKLSEANLFKANLIGANLRVAYLHNTNLIETKIGWTIFGTLDLSKVIGLEKTIHLEPSVLSLDTIQLSKGEIPETFLRGCGLSDWEIESSKLYKPNLNNKEIDEILYKIHDLRAHQSIQVSPLFISYSHSDSAFVDKIETYLNKKGVRFWRDIHDMKSGRMEKQIDRAMRLNPTVLLILSKDSLRSDWVEHEVRTARILEKEMKRDVLCPVALDDSWKNSPWAKRIMEQITEYNILDFSEWKDANKFENTFNKLIDGLELFYK